VLSRDTASLFDPVYTDVMITQERSSLVSHSHTDVMITQERRQSCVDDNTEDPEYVETLLQNSDNESAHLILAVSPISIKILKPVCWEPPMMVNNKITDFAEMPQSEDNTQDPVSVDDPFEDSV